MRCAFIALILTLGSGSFVEGAPRLGVASAGPDSSVCVAFRGESLRPGDEVLVFLFSPPRVADGRIRMRRESACNESSEAAQLSYVLNLRHQVMEEGEVGIALLDRTARVEYSNGEFIVHTEGAKTPLRFSQCASHEGLHLTAWRGNRRTWHEYWYLGFDLEPTCPDEEVRN